MPDFVSELFPMMAGALAERSVKLVTNAGAVNPHACAAAVRAICGRLGVQLRVAVVDGDDLMANEAELRAAGRLAGVPQDASCTTINAYLGAFPIARALALNADIVITGRVVDSALALGPLIHEFGWTAGDYDLLAAGSLIGHILECGAQASGGIFTDWREAGDFTHIGYPIAECAADGIAVITKPPETGGLVSVGTVAEQLLYEIGDPRSYQLPDVVVDFTHVRLEQVGPDRVRMSGGRGRPPSGDYKVNFTWDDGWLAGWGFFMRGQGAAEKAKVIADVVLKRGEQLLRDRNLPALRRRRVEIVGDEESYGLYARGGGSREVFCRITIDTESPAAFGLMLRETALGTVSMTPGIAGSFMMQNPLPIARLGEFMIPSVEVPARVSIDDRSEIVQPTALPRRIEAPAAAVFPERQEPCDITVPLRKLAWARSGDKGDVCNIGVVARKAEGSTRWRLHRQFAL